ncbi:MAG: 2Fe-2S iron-sulfur cluster-binding protein, partial [Limnohabitans sp.]|nr:2Fe-2S iron-sulfur cluster-binding protein [Limnohabitans sp.]
MSFQISVQPSGRSFTADDNETLLAAGIRQGIGLPYGCKDGACGSCKCKKISGTVVHGPHQDKALSADEEAQGLVLTCCATAQSDVVLESKQVTAEGGLPVKKMPVRVVSLDKKSHDVIVMKLQLPANDVMKFHA